MERGRSKGPQHRTVTALADALDLDEAARKELVETAREGRLRDHWWRPAGLCELPSPVDDFTGRSAELAWTDDLLHASPAGTGLITGPAGLGKTTLAVRAAHALRANFPDGTYFIDLFGISPQPLAADEALARLLRALGVAEQRIPHDVSGRASTYRSLLRDRRVLVVLDNAASEGQVRPLLPGDGAGRALLTTGDTTVVLWLVSTAWTRPGTCKRVQTALPSGAISSGGLDSASVLGPAIRTASTSR